MEVKKIKLENNETLFYREHGYGSKAVIFVHGNMCSGAHFLPFIKNLPICFKCYLIDLRGFGESTYNNQIESIQDLSDDLYSFATQLNLNNLILVGWSAGGSVCMQFGGNYPELVRKIVLIDSVSHSGCPLFNREGQVYRNKSEMSEDPEISLSLNAIKNKNFNVMSKLWADVIYTNQKPLHEDNQIYINETLKQRNLVDIYWALCLFNISDAHNGYIEGNNLISKIKAPTLLFWGENDMIIKENVPIETVNALGRLANLIILKNSGHSPLIDCPEILMQNIIEFVL